MKVREAARLPWSHWMDDRPLALLLITLAGICAAGCGGSADDPAVDADSSAGTDGGDSGGGDASTDGGGDGGDSGGGDGATDGGGTSDGGGGDSGPGGTNPEVTLIRELTFEQPPGTNGWADSPNVVFNWQEAATGRDFVPDAMIRGAGGINVPSVTTEAAYRGEHALKMVMEDWGRSTFRQDIEMVGGDGVTRLFDYGTTYVLGFAMRIEHETKAPGGYQLYHQLHYGLPPREGYGITNNPMLALQRTNDTDMQLILRHNEPGGERVQGFHDLPGAVRAGQWVRWVIKFRLNNFDSGENALVEVYSAIGEDPLELHLRVDDRPVGYVYASGDERTALVLDMYGTPYQADAAAFFDEVRIVEGDLAPSSVDPVEWVSYQHPLNQPYDADLTAR